MNDFKIEQRRRNSLTFPSVMPENRLMKWLPLLFMVSTAYGAECSMRTILQENSSLMPPDKEVIEPVRGQGGFINPFYTGPSSAPDGIAEMPSVRKSRLLGNIQPRPLEEGQQIVSEVRESMMREIAGSGNQSPHQRLMIERVRDIKITISDCQGAEGSNDSTQYEIKLCQNALKMPKLALVSLIAHELGHSLDLCNLGSKRYHNHSTGQRFLDTSPDITREMRQAAELTDNGIPLAENPLIGAYQCLNQTNDYYRPIPSERTELCNETLYTESGAQIWAARATGQFVKAHPPSREEAIGLFANSMTGMNKGTTNKEHDIDSIYFADANIRDIFGCSPKPSQNCLVNFRPAETRSLGEMIGAISSPGPNVNCGDSQ